MGGRQSPHPRTKYLDPIPNTSYSENIFRQELHRRRNWYLQSKAFREAKYRFEMFAASSSSANRCLTVVARLTTTSRSLSYSQRGNPRYSVFNPDCIFNLGVMFPSFRFSRNNYVAVDPMKKGRILFEWVPRSAQGTSNQTASSGISSPFCSSV